MDGRSPRLLQAQEEEKYLSRMRKHLPDKFRDMCNMHLAFILNLSDDKLEAILDPEPSVNRKRLTLALAPIFRKKVKTGSCLFGAPLTHESVCLMTPLIKFLSLKENVSKEGLFRKPGNRQRMRNLREFLIAKGPGVEIDTSIYNAYDVAGVLKEFLRDMPEPLLSDKHMEAHRQINGLGRYARTAEDQVRYATKKLSALQLLMQLLPSPFCKMTKSILTLLHDVSNTSETKMTPSTLATIFAPIFFLDRKVSALDVCDAVKEAEPALTFMIENSEKLFKVPKELSVDIINYWKELEATSYDIKPTDSTAKLSQSYKIRKSVSGRTLNTAICYIDREQSKNVDIASHTQAELNNLFAHVHALPDTPSNQRIKDLMARRSRTPVSSGGKHRRSKSIGASIRKMVPSLSKSKAKSLDMSVQSQATPYCDTKKLKSKFHQTVTECKVLVVDCFPAVENKKRKADIHKITHNENTSFPRLSSTTATIAHSIASCTDSLPALRSPHSPIARPTMTRKRVSLDSQCVVDHCTPPKQECKDSKTQITAEFHRDNCQSSMTTVPLLSNIDKFLLSHNDGDSTASNSILLSDSTCEYSPVKLCVQSSSLPSLNIETPQELKDIVKSPKMMGESENEINYLQFLACKKEKSSISRENIISPLSSPLTRRPLRPCNAPGTPIMSRAFLQISCSTFETSL